YLSYGPRASRVPSSRAAKVKPRTLPSGSVIAGRFRIEHTLAQGGMAAVFVAEDLASRRLIALKLLRPELGDQPAAISRFRREGEILSSLNHSGIVKVDTFGALDDGTLFIAMELLHGETLASRMRREPPVSLVEFTPILRQTCDALLAAHQRGV